MAGTHHVGDLGVVAHAADGVAEVLLDSSDATVKVLVNNLTETAARHSDLEAFGRYGLYQLVMLNDAEVGLIVRISAAAAELLMSSACRSSSRVGAGVLPRRGPACAPIEPRRCQHHVLSNPWGARAALLTPAVTRRRRLPHGGDRPTPRQGPAARGGRGARRGCRTWRTGVAARGRRVVRACSLVSQCTTRS